MRDLDAAKTLALGEKLKKKQPRVFRGDGLGTSLRQRFSSLDDQVLVSFKSILQGDHLGVELATQSHANLLRDFGLLSPGVRMVSDRPLPSLMDVHGLCIDDFFAISVEDRKSDPLGDRSFTNLRAPHRKMSMESMRAKLLEPT